MSGCNIVVNVGSGDSGKECVAAAIASSTATKKGLPQPKMPSTHWINGFLQTHFRDFFEKNKRTLAQGFPYSALQALNLSNDYHLAVFNREEPVGQSITNRLHCERREQEGSTPITIVVDRAHAFACSYNTGEDYDFKDC